MCQWHLYCLSSHVYECVSVLWAHTFPASALASSKPQSPLELYRLPHSLGHWHHIYLYAHVFLFELLIDISGCHVMPPSEPVLSSPLPVIFHIMLHMDIPRKVCQMYRCDTWVLPAPSLSLLCLCFGSLLWRHSAMRQMLTSKRSSRSSELCLKMHN